MKKTILFSSLTLLLLISFTIPAKAQNIPDFLVNEQGSIDGAQQTTPSIDGDGNGNYVLCWKDKRNGTDFDILAQIYLDGTPLGGNFKVNDDNGTRRQYTPTLAVDPNLNFVIAWIDRRNGNPNTDWDLYAQRFSNDGTPLGSNFIVNDEFETDEKSHPSIAIDSLGNFVVVWGDKRSEPWDIYGQRFTNEGTALGENFKINDDIGNYYQLWPTCVSDKSGNLIVCWTDKRYNSDRHIYAQRYSPDGTTLGNNFQVNDNSAGTNNILPDIAIDGNSNFIIAWEDNRNGHPDVYAQRYMIDGTIVGENFKINDNSVNISHRNPSITSDWEGNFTVCWEDNRNDYNDVYARRYSNNGTALGGDFKVSDDITYNTKQENSIIAADQDGNFIICWEDHRFGYNGEIFAQSYLNDGTPVDENFIVNDDVGSENEQWPSIALDGNENFIIVWAENRTIGDGIYGQRYTSDGTALGNNFKVNDDTGDNWTLYPSVAANTDGSFIVTWSDTRSGDLPLIYAQRFANDASPLGSNFQVNYLSAAINYKPEVVCKPNGDFIICWGDLPEDSKDNNYSQNMESNYMAKKLLGVADIWIQQFMSDGTPIGENLKVNDDGGFESQTNPDIAIDASGNFVVAWEDKRNDIYEIYLQLYTTEGTPVGSNFKAEDVILCDLALSPSVCYDELGNFTVVWKDIRNGGYDIFYKQFYGNGIAIDNSFQVSSENGIHNQSFPSISIQDDGRFIVSWADDRNGTYDVFAQRFWSDGLPYANNFQIHNDDIVDQSGQAVILNNNRIFNTWHDNKSGQTGYDIWANVMDWDTGVGLDENLSDDIEQTICLYQNYPNPFSNSTTIKFDLTGSAKVKIEIFNHFGQKTETLLNKSMPAGSHEVDFFTNKPDGIYLYRLVANPPGEVGEFQLTKRMMVIR